MRLLIVGCEYAGKTTLARAISHRLLAVLAAPSARSAADHSGADGAGRASPRPIQWHNHFVVPRLDGHLIVRAAGDRTVIGKEAADLNTAEDEAQIMALRPSVLEQLQRHNIWRHLHPDLFRDDDTFFINHYYADAVYAPLYYGYGQPGTFSDRSARARAWDTELLERTPDTVLVLVRATAAAIRERLRQAAREREIIQEADIPHILDCFDHEYEQSLIPRKFVLDTTTAAADATFAQFLEHVRPHLSTTDRRRLRGRQASGAARRAAGAEEKAVQ